jgi:Tfp pilus assembly protein PilF
MKNDIEDMVKKAALAHKEGRLADAEKAYLDILKGNPDSGLALNALGTVFLNQSQPAKAKQVFEKAARLTPPDLSACYNLARLKHMICIKS